MHVHAVGVDTETVHGEPISFQFYSKELDIEEIIFLKSGKESTRKFFEFLDNLPYLTYRDYVLFGHNLAFDMISFFYDRYARLREDSIRDETWYGWNVQIVYAAVRFAVFTRKGRTVTLIDTGAYFVTTLEKLALIFCPNLPKLSAPKGLGSKRFTRQDAKFCRYAMRDSEIAYFVGLFILERHREWDISLAVSAPHFASKVFRKVFLKKSIPLPPRKIVYASMAAYHGGKNGITVKPGLYKRVYSLDIKSAYPFSMSQFPSFSNPDLYMSIEGKGTPKKLPQFGVYKITGHAKKCDWPSLYTHNFKPLQGDFAGVWTTGFELNEALRSREVTLSHTEGYFYDADRDKEYSPFSGFVHEFFKRKETAPEKTQREFNKLCMNALYGKFMQTRRMSGMQNLTFDMDENKLIDDSSIQAGGMFNPFIASLITGSTRAYIHRLEHKYKALHTATDGIFARNKGKLRQRKNLGDLSLESCGDALILRNKLYILYARLTDTDKRAIRTAKRNGKPCPVRLSTVRKGYKIIKDARHGFHADVFTLEQMYAKGIREYEYVKVNKLRESLRRNLVVNDFVSRSGTVTLPGDEG